MEFDEIMSFLEQNGSEQTKKVFKRHGAQEPFFGVKVADLKKVEKKVKCNYEISKRLYSTGNSDAMYLAGLIADPESMTREDLQSWAEGAYWYMVSDYTVADVASRSRYGFELARKWIDSDSEFIESAGWSTFSSFLSYHHPSEEQEKELANLLERAERTLQDAKNRVRYSMNSFIIACGSFHQNLTGKAISVADKIGKVNVDMGGTACKVPPAKETINKVIARGKHGVKRKEGGY